MNRSPSIILVAAFLFVAALISSVVALSLLVPGTPLDRMWELNRPAYVAFKALGRVSGPLFLMLGLCTAATGFGLLRGRRWAWWLAIGLFAVNGLGDIVGLAIDGNLVRSAAGVSIAGVFLYLLLRRLPAR